ncbi:MAG TPA: adenylate/guanylate cyclase domain-containing protein, partial [Kiloniellales bacterium]|nr:adenylate/guanylate cyclase domain-containing protein [Kiloniellales bacterium]
MGRRLVDIERWLTDLGLGRYAEAFRDHAIDETVLAGLTNDDLKDLGVELVGHRRRILDAIARLRAEAAPPTAGPHHGDLPASDAPVAAPAGPEPTADAERRMVTVLFCDLVGSTRLASQHDPEELRDVITDYQRFCVSRIERFGGHVALFLGDGLLAYFGYPKARENEAEWALRTGLAILEGIGALPRPGGHDLAVRVGVATGVVVVGELLGTGDLRQQSVIGETPNLAARFQQLAQPGQLICGAVTRRLASGLFDFEDIGPQTIKGFDQPVSAHRVLRERPVESRFAATHARRVGRMVGRRQEAALLFERWATAVQGEGQVVLLAGDAGIGKSRLMQDLIAQVESEPHFRIVFQCSPHYRDSPLFPPRRQLELAAGFESGDDAAERLRKLRALLAKIPGTEAYEPELANFLSIASEAPPQDDSPERTRQRVLEALAGRIVTAARLQPVLFLVEDAHWIDPSTEELVTQLIERIRALPVLLVVTYRPEYGCAWVRHPRAVSLKLSHLSRAQSKELLTDLTAGREVPARLIDQIVVRGDGVPLFLEEMAKSILDSGVPPVALLGAGESAAASIPQTLYDILLSRLDRDATAKQVAQIASVIGREFPVSLLTAIAELPDARLRAGLESLVETGLLVHHTGTGQETYSFRHGLLHEVTYNTLLLRRRRELHRRIAESLAAASKDAPLWQPEVVARHFDEAGLLDRAAEGWLEAGRQALAIGAYREALQDLEAGLRVVQRVPEGRQRHAMELPLQMTKAETLRSARFTGGDEALAACRRTRELCDELGDVTRLVRVLRLEAGITFNRADPSGTERVGREFLRIAEAHKEPIAEVLGHQTLGFVGFFRGELGPAR